MAWRRTNQAHHQVFLSRSRMMTTKPEQQMMGNYRLRMLAVLAPVVVLWLVNPAMSRVNLEQLNLITLPTPPFQYHLSAATKEKTIKQLKLKLISFKPNQITDDTEWFQKNGLTLPTYDVPNPFLNIEGNVPAFVPREFNHQVLVKAIRCKDTVILIYGANLSESRYLIVLNSTSGQFIYGFDLINYSNSPKYTEQDKDYVNQEIRWASHENNILYVSHAHRTYASASGGLNAYITSIDTATGELLWRTQPLVSNAANFAIIGDTIVAGYGFTAEPDYLYLINKKTGQVYEQIKLKSGPDYILLKGNELYVRTYNTDYLFQVDGF